MGEEVRDSLAKEVTCELGQERMRRSHVRRVAKHMEEYMRRL